MEVFKDSKLIEESFEVKLPTLLTGEKQRSKSEEKRRREEKRRSEMEKVRREKMQVREKIGKSPNTLFFHCFVAPESRKAGSLKRQVRSQLAR